MALMLGNTYDALIGAGATPEQARKAAEELATRDADIADLKSSMKLMQWMLGFNLAFTLAILWKVFIA
jgi:hypothetical protein